MKVVDASPLGRLTAVTRIGFTDDPDEVVVRYRWRRPYRVAEALSGLDEALPDEVLIERVVDLSDRARSLRPAGGPLLAFGRSDRSLDDAQPADVWVDRDVDAIAARGAQRAICVRTWAARPVWDGHCAERRVEHPAEVPTELLAVDPVARRGVVASAAPPLDDDPEAAPRGRVALIATDTGHALWTADAAGFDQRSALDAVFAGDRVLVDAGGTVHLVASDTGVELPLPHRTVCSGRAWAVSPGGAHVVVAYGPRVWRYDGRTGERCAEASLPDAWVTALAVTSDGSCVIATVPRPRLLEPVPDGAAVLWSWTAASALRPHVDLPVRRVTAIALEGDRAVVGGEDGPLVVLPWSTGGGSSIG
ncbi:MAG: PQQ-binding-like beta-propeller repeat protein [Myxococcota bacterium]